MESLGALAGGIAHDFNNVLVGVLGGASLAQRDLPRDSAARRHLDVLIASAERGSELVREILACAGKAPLEKAPAAPGALVRADLLAADLRDRVRLRCRVAEGLPSVAVDRALLWRALAHLVRNGAESYGDAGGTVSARALLVEVGAEALARAVVGRELAPGSYVCLEVADRAAGMPAPTLARAFDPYFTTKPSARGLGLTAVRGIVAGHDGALLVESTPGKGTVARVLLPPAAATPDPPGAESERGLDALQGRFDAPERRFDAPQRRFNAPQRYGRALIADDESTVRAVVAEMLAEVGFEVLEATDGVEAVELARANPDLSVALLDVTMPRLDGAGAQRILRVDRPDLPVLLMSGFTRVDEAALRGAAGFLRKPFRLSDLARELERVLPASASRSW
jgi:CheY-like chemotaxis protein